MGLRLTQGKGLSVKLAKISDRSTRQLRRVHHDAAEQIAETAGEMAPRLDGHLEQSFRISERRGLANRLILFVQARHLYNPKTGFDYSVFTHEAEYELGELSRAKDQAGKHRVGRKYLSRALQHVDRDQGLLARMINAVRKGQK